MYSLVGKVYAQGISNPALAPAVGSGNGVTIVGNIISGVVGIFIIIAFVWALLQFLNGALRWISSSGDKQQLETAQHSITQAIVGLVIVASAWAIMTLLSQFLGLGNFPTFNLPTVTGNNLGP